MKKKTIFILVSAILVGIATTLVIIDLLKNAHINILVTPLDSKIFINDKEYKNGTYRLFPGDVSIRIERDGMNTEELTLSLASHHTELLYVYLTNDDDKNAFSYYEKSIDDYEALKLIGKDEAAQKFITKTEQLLSIRDVLPITSFSANPTPSPVNNMMGRETIIKDATTNSDCERLVCLSILDNTGSLDTATKLLKSYGFNINDYQIIKESY